MPLPRKFPESQNLVLFAALFLTCCTAQQPSRLIHPVTAAAQEGKNLIEPTRTQIPPLSSPTLPSNSRPVSSSTPVLLVRGPGSIFCPILLYHRIDIPPYPSNYYVTPENFHSQMQALKDWGYTSIPISLLVRALKEGAQLPEHPIVITFDDGDISVYTNAFPIMQEFGFVGVNYLVSNRMKAKGYMHLEQIRELAQAGWEVGSHSITHVDLRFSKDAQREIAQSRFDLEAALGLPVTTFAYPTGAMNSQLRKTVSQFYVAAVGLGPTNNQSNDKLYYLWRRPINYDYNLETFRNFLLK